MNLYSHLTCSKQKYQYIYRTTNCYKKKHQYPITIYINIVFVMLNLLESRYRTLFLRKVRMSFQSIPNCSPFLQPISIAPFGFLEHRIRIRNLCYYYSIRYYFIFAYMLRLLNCSCYKLAELESCLHFYLSTIMEHIFSRVR